MLEHRRLDGEQLAKLDDRGAALLIVGVQLDELLDRGEERVEVQHERGQLAEAQLVAQHHPPADEQQRGHAGHADDGGARAVDGGDVPGEVVGVAVAAGEPAMVDDVAVLAVVRGDDAGALQALGQVGEHRGDGVALAAVADVGGAPEPDGRRQQQRHHKQQRDRGQLGVVAEQHDRDEHHGQALHGELGQAFLEKLLQRFDVGASSGS